MHGCRGQRARRAGGAREDITTLAMARTGASGEDSERGTNEQLLGARGAQPQSGQAGIVVRFSL
jgi:hypothetical protein